VDPDIHFKMPGVDARGVDALVGMLQAYRTAFPDLRHTFQSHVESGDAIAIELLVNATHTGPMVTPHGTFQATGKKVTWDSCDVIRIKNGRVIQWHVYHDPAEFNALMK
jgi:predicted ester cyclase